MVFFILNVVLCGIMIAVSFNIDTRHGGNRNTNPLINMILFLAVLFGFMAATLASCFWLPAIITRIIGRAAFVLIAWYSISLCAYLMTFPDYERTTFLTVFQIILCASAFIFIFFNGHVISGIEINVDNRFKIHSDRLIDTDWGDNHFWFTWLDIYLFIYLIFIPFFTMIMALVRAENAQTKLKSQQLVYECFGIITSWIVYAIIVYAISYQSMMFSLSVVCFIPETFLMLKGARTNEVSDKRAVRNDVLKILVRFILPSLFTGLIWLWLWPLFSVSKVGFILLFFLAASAINALWLFSDKRLSKLAFLRSNKYEKALEDEMSQINFEGDTKDITNILYKSLNKYMDISHLQILVDNSEGELQTTYSSNDKNYSISVENPVFEKLLNVKQQVVFRERAFTEYTLANVKYDIIKILDQNDADGLIVLNEGRHVIGMMILGKKISGNPFSDYDYEVLTHLYSNFFVIGYYMKNIVNESVVGTVNREIRMSGQIITSIQENMDKIKSSKIDVGYRMIPAHNIGGEFIDLIRLSENRHIFIVGALNSRGIAASMNMVILKSIIRTFLQETSDFKLLVEKVNSFIRESLPKGTYFSGLFGLIDFKTDTMYYINCGIPALFLYTKAYNNVIEIQGEGRVLGFAKDVSNLVKVKKTKLAAGDIVVASTDGLFETQSLRGDRYGKERVQKVITENTTYDADRMTQFQYDSLAKFVSTQIENDVTVLVMKYLGGK